MYPLSSQVKVDNKACGDNKPIAFEEILNEYTSNIFKSRLSKKVDQKKGDMDEMIDCFGTSDKINIDENLKASVIKEIEAYHSNFICSKFQLIMIKQDINRLKLLLKLGLAKGPAFILCWLRITHLTKKYFCTELQSGREVKIPEVLSSAYLPLSYRFYDSIILFVKNFIEATWHQHSGHDHEHEHTFACKFKDIEELAQVQSSKYAHIEIERDHNFKQIDQKRMVFKNAPKLFERKNKTLRLKCIFANGLSNMKWKGYKLNLLEQFDRQYLIPLKQDAKDP